MYRYVLKRLMMLIPVILGVILLIFIVMDLAPGDPVLMVASPDATEAELEALRVEMGLDKGLLHRYVSYVGNMLKGNLGTSYTTKRAVLEVYMERLPETLKLAVGAVLVAILCSIPLGIIAAVHQNSWKDSASMVTALIGVSMPSFWLGLLLMLLFSLKLGWFPSGGTAGFKSIVLPSITMGMSLAAVMTRTTRSAMLDVLRSDYLRTARSKGVNENKVILKHAFKNALIPIITIFGSQFSYVIGGAVLVETIFSYPGVGKMVVDAIGNRDIPSVTGGIVMTTIMVTCVNLVIDLLYAFVDPRIKGQYVK